MQDDNSKKNEKNKAIFFILDRFLSYTKIINNWSKSNRYYPLSFKLHIINIGHSRATAVPSLLSPPANKSPVDTVTMVL